MLKICHVSYSDRLGGAAIAAHRLVNAQRNSGMDASLLVREKVSRDPFVFACGSIAEAKSLGLQSSMKDRVYQEIYKGRTYASNTLFSLELEDVDITLSDVLLKADIIHLHWVTYAVNPIGLRRLAGLRKPIVWTLHDFAPMTGGCHYPAGCEGFTADCAPCPQLIDGGRLWPAHILDLRRQAVESIAHLSVTAPSAWLVEEAKRSAVFSNRRVLKQPNCVPTRVYNRAGRMEAKKRLGLDENDIVVLLAAFDLQEHRKGGSLALRAFGELRRSLPSRVAQRLKLCTLGGHSVPDVEGTSPIALGQFSEDTDIADRYRAADFLILSSHEDNFPNTIIEAGACGAIVVAAPNSGPEVALTAETLGILASAATPAAIAAAMLPLVLDSEARAAMANKVARHIEATYAPAIVAGQFQLEYEALLRAGATNTAAAPTSTIGRRNITALVESHEEFAERRVDLVPSADAMTTVEMGFEPSSDSLCLIMDSRSGGRPWSQQQEAAQFELVTLRVPRLPVRACSLYVEIRNANDFDVRVMVSFVGSDSSHQLVEAGSRRTVEVPLLRDELTTSGEAVIIRVVRDSGYGVVVGKISGEAVFIAPSSDSLSRGSQLVRASLPEVPHARVRVLGNLYPLEYYLSDWCCWTGPLAKTPITLSASRCDTVVLLVAARADQFGGDAASLEWHPRDAGRKVRSPTSVLRFESGWVALLEISVSSTGEVGALVTPHVAQPDAGGRALGLLLGDLVALPLAAGGLSVEVDRVLSLAGFGKVLEPPELSDESDPYRVAGWKSRLVFGKVRLILVVNGEGVDPNMLESIELRLGTLCSTATCEAIDGTVRMQADFEFKSPEFANELLWPRNLARIRLTYQDLPPDVADRDGFALVLGTLRHSTRNSTRPASEAPLLLYSSLTPPVAAPGPFSTPTLVIGAQETQDDYKHIYLVLNWAVSDDSLVGSIPFKLQIYKGAPALELRSNEGGFAAFEAHLPESWSEDSWGPFVRVCIDSSGFIESEQGPWSEATTEAFRNFAEKAFDAIRENASRLELIGDWHGAWLASISSLHAASERTLKRARGDAECDLD